MTDKTVIICGAHLDARKLVAAIDAQIIASRRARIAALPPRYQTVARLGYKVQTLGFRVQRVGTRLISRAMRAAA